MLAPFPALEEGHHPPLHNVSQEWLSHTGLPYVCYLTQSDPHSTLGDCRYSVHFTQEETKAYQGQVACLRSKHLGDSRAKAQIWVWLAIKPVLTPLRHLRSCTVV